MSLAEFSGCGFHVAVEDLGEVALVSKASFLGDLGYGLVASAEELG